MHLALRRIGAAALGLALGAGLATAVAAPAQAESNGGVRVMPLGDSITDGFNVPGGYRINLWQRMAAGGHTVDFVGSGFNGPAALGDHGHEGHSGWRIWDLDANITGWMRTSAPRTVLLHIGTNRTHLVDMHAALTTADLADGLHPNAGGYDKMAARWYAALQSVPGSLTPVTAPPVGSPALLSNPQSTRCLDITGTATADGAQAVIWDCHGGTNQQFTRTTVGELRVLGDRCLDVNANGTADGTKIQAWRCNGSAAQRFTVNPNGTVVATTSGKCLDVRSNGTANGTVVQLYRCNGTAAQRWTVR